MGRVNLSASGVWGKCMELGRRGIWTVFGKVQRTPNIEEERPVSGIWNFEKKGENEKGCLAWGAAVLCRVWGRWGWGENPGIGLQEILVTLVQESANGDPAGHLGHCFCLFIYLNICFIYLFLAALGLSCGMWDLSSLTRDRTCVPYIGRRILNHWTTREVPGALLLISGLPHTQPRLCGPKGLEPEFEGNVETPCVLFFTTQNF